MVSGYSRAVELAGSVDEDRQLHLEEPLPPVGPGPVRVIILFPEDVDVPETDWVTFLAANPAFEFLKDEAEDIYGPDDGRPFSADWGQGGARAVPLRRPLRVQGPPGRRDHSLKTRPWCVACSSACAQR